MFEKWDMPEAKANLEFMPPVVFLKEAQVKAPSVEIQAGLPGSGAEYSGSSL